MYKNIILSVVVLFLLSMSSLVHARSKLLEEQVPISIPKGISIKKLDEVIDGALAEKEWVKEESSDSVPRILKVAYYIRTHKIWSQIEYDNKSLKLSYIDSENMNYKEKKGKQYIHPNYNVWTQGLLDQVKLNIETGESYSSNKKPTSAPKSSNPPPKEPFSKFSSFKLEETTLAEAFQKNKGNRRTAINLDHNLGLNLKPKLISWSQKSEKGRTLIIKPHIEAVRFIGSGARFWAGALVGRSWIYVRLKYIDESSGVVIAEPELYRIAKVGNGITLAKNDYRMVEEMAMDIANYTESNYGNAVGGGQLPPLKIKQGKK